MNKRFFLSILFLSFSVVVYVGAMNCPDPSGLIEMSQSKYSYDSEARLGTGTYQKWKSIADSVGNVRSLSERFHSKHIVQLKPGSLVQKIAFQLYSQAKKEGDFFTRERLIPVSVPEGSCPFKGLLFSKQPMLEAHKDIICAVRKKNFDLAQACFHGKNEQVTKMLIEGYSPLEFFLTEKFTTSFPIKKAYLVPPECTNSPNLDKPMWGVPYGYVTALHMILMKDEADLLEIIGNKYGIEKIKQIDLHSFCSKPIDIAYAYRAEKCIGKLAEWGIKGDFAQRNLPYWYSAEKVKEIKKLFFSLSEIDWSRGDSLSFK